MSDTHHFEFDADKYRQASTHQQEWGTQLIAELRLKGNENILDLGCGNGVLTAKLAQLVPNGHVVGIDSSRNMIAAAQALGDDRIAFRCLDINKLDYSGEFDLVFSNATLHWVKDHRSLLNNVHRTVRPGGACRFNFAADGNCSHFNGVVRELMKEPLYERFFVDFDWPWFMPQLDEYESLFNNGQFSDHCIWGENADRYFPNASAMTAWMDQPSLVPFLRCLDGPEQKSFRNAAVERMLALTKQPDGTQFETFRRINVLAKR
jgi:trans-aconitate 2-methyltransferase